MRMHCKHDSSEYKVLNESKTKLVCDINFFPFCFFVDISTLRNLEWLNLSGNSIEVRAAPELIKVILIFLALVSHFNTLVALCFVGN